MSGSRHFTVVDDWVILNQEISSTEFRVYALLRGAVINAYGGIPKSGIKVTAGWVAAISDGLFSRITAQRALRGLSEKGVLGRLNNPKQEGDASQFEFIVYPGDGYDGATNIQTEVSRLKKRTTRAIQFEAVEIDGNPRNGLTRIDHVAPSAEDLLGQPKEIEPVAEEQEFDLSGLDGIGQEGPALTESQQEFAEELEQATGVSTTPHLRLMAGACRRIADAYGPALESGWIPRDLARRLAAELNPKVRMPEKLLVSKAEDIGKPPKAAAEAMPQEVRRADGLNGYVPPKQFRKRDGLPLSPEEQRKIDEKLRSYQAQRERANWLKS